MKNIQEVLIPAKMHIMEAIKVLDRVALQILLVVNNEGRLLGTVTDGDIRRCILRGIDMNAPVSIGMNHDPVTVDLNTGRDTVLTLMRSKSIHCVPVVDSSYKVVGLETESHLLRQGVDDTCVVIMAGGLGLRLRPLTESVPKPLLEVNGKPMLEHIIGRLTEQGFRRFILSVNYKSEMIKKHFGDGSNLSLEISYIEEGKPLGTGGALSLLSEEDLSNNIIVMNGDLLTTLNFRQLLDFHRTQDSIATMCVRDYSFRVPYGVVQIEGECFVDMVEKPAHSYFINTGIYVISSGELQLIPKNEFFDLPDLFSLLREKGKKVTVFPLCEDWRDIGNFRDYELANTGSKCDNDE